MSQLFQIHPDNPQSRLLRQAVAIIKRGGLVVYPTDSGYALGCRVADEEALMRIRKLRHLDESHNMTLVLSDLTELSTYAVFDPTTFRLLKDYTPGPYTFLLKGTKDVPRLLLSPNRKTVGIRIPDHPIALALLEMLDQPLMSTTLILPGAEAPLIEPQAIRDLLGQHIDLVVDGGHCGLEPTTVVDLTGDKPKVLRKGKGDPTPFL